MQGCVTVANLQEMHVSIFYMIYGRAYRKEFGTLDQYGDSMNFINFRHLHFAVWKPYKRQPLLYM